MTTSTSETGTAIVVPPSKIPYCTRCHKPLGKQFVRALEGSFHPECFLCMDCNTMTANKFFPYTAEDGQVYPLCEHDYFRRLGLLCATCNEALRGPYIIALNKRYHTNHFTCSACPTAFGPDDSYYEHNGQVFCHFHYSTQFAVSCAGCQMAILKQYVEIDKKDTIEHWHPECYMIHKFWNVRVGNPVLRDTDEVIPQEPPPKNPTELAERQREMEEKVYRIWTVLSAFEESSAVCISEMLLHVSNGAYVEGICLSERFLVHVEALFSGVDVLDQLYLKYGKNGFKYSREAKMLCKKIINFFSLLSRTQEMKKLGVTQELLSLVTGLAHYLKILIRVALTTALRLELVVCKPVAVPKLLAKLMEVAGKESYSRNSQQLVKAKTTSDLCYVCKITIEDQCIKYGEYRWHMACFNCRQCKLPLAHDLIQATFNLPTQSVLCLTCAGAKEDEVATPFEHVTKLTQYAYLLRIALSRLCSFLQITDSQLSSVDFNIKTKLYLPKDVPPTKDASSSPNTVQPEKSLAEELPDEKAVTPTYPTHIADARSVPATNLNRKVSRSFKTAKRSTILGNTSTASRLSTSTIPENEEEQPNSRTIPARLDSLRRADQHKDLPPLPHDEQQPQTATKPEDNIPPSVHKGIRLDDLPKVAAQAVTERPNTTSHQHSPSMRTAAININPATGKPRVYLSELSALQYMIIRHVAVVQIEPYVREHFTLSELLNLIDTKKTSIWGKLFTSLMHGGSKKVNKGKEDGTFGVPLDVLTEKTGVESNLGASPSPVRIAAFIDDAVTAMRQMDMSIEGIFRKNGNIRRLKDVSDQLDRNPHDVDLSSEPPIQIAALLKKFLRELPDPLLTFKLHGLFTCAMRLENPAACKRVIHLACCMLPRVNRDTMEVLFLFFRWVASFSHVTTDVGSRMDIPNLARVIAPNILTTNSKDPLKDDSFTSIRVVELMLECFDELCLVPEDLEPFLEDPSFKDGTADMSSKDFLKKVEQMMKHSNKSSASTATTTTTSPISNVLPSTASSLHDVRYLELQQMQNQQQYHQQQQFQQYHSPTSIYAQQGYLPYVNRHPSSNTRSTPYTQRNSSLNNGSHHSLHHSHSVPHRTSSAAAAAATNDLKPPSTPSATPSTELRSS